MIPGGRWAGGWLALCLSACTAQTPVSQDTALRIDGLRFENRSRTPVESVRLIVPATGNFVSCGRIAPGASCAALFPGVAYSGHPIEIQWVQGGTDWRTGEIPLEIDPLAREAGSGEVRVLIVAPGSSGALLVPSGQPAISVP